MTLSDIHRAYLNGHAISDAVIGEQGIRSEGDDIVFTWREGEHVTEQRRPWPGAGGVYFWAKDADLHLNVIRDPGPDAPVLLCEGTKQSLAVASWAPAEFAVMGMPGCYGWTMSRKLDLSRFAGREVLVMLDADAAGNLDVYEAGTRLASELAMEDPPGIAKFIPSPAWGKDGIDDYLGRIAEGRRADRLAKLIAKAQDKPSDKKPAKRKVREQPPDSGGDPFIVVNKRRKDVIREIIAALRERWDARELFCYGNVLTRLRDGKTEPLNRGAFLRWLSEGTACYKYTPPGLQSPGKYEDSWPDPPTVEAVMASADEFAPLNQLLKMPFIRPDGTVCAKNGYDAATGTFLVMGNSGMDRLDIPDAPSQAEAAAAAEWLLNEWLGDMPFKDDFSRANALALVITPFIRGLVPLVPLAIINGLQIGVGKNLLADCLSIMMSGASSTPLQWIPENDDEVRKQILSAFRQGDSLIVFDEAHRLGGAALSRALTALTYTDRVLGVSQMASYPNRAVWASLGNNVEVDSDMSRRGFWIELFPLAPNPQDRDESSFRHPDLRGWTAGSRPEIVTAVLTIIRSWFAAGCPEHSRGSLMGSFEAWDKMLSGILHYAGAGGFLGDLAEKREEANPSGGFWKEHLAWLHGVFGAEPFSTLQARQAVASSSGAWSVLPGLENTMDPAFTQKLGMRYHSHRGQWTGDLRLAKIGKGFGNVSKWQVEKFGETGGCMTSNGGVHGPKTLSDLREGDQGDSGTSLTPTRSANFHALRTENGRSDDNFSVIDLAGESPRVPLVPLTVFDLETADSGRLFTYPRGEFVRLAGILDGDRPRIVPVPELIAELERAPEISGHNVLGFDLLALAWHHGADYASLAVKAADTELIARQANPPRSRDTHSADSYDLTTVAQQLGLPGKTDDLARLKSKHGGYDKIPLDDPEYRSYLEGDLRASAAVITVMRERYPADPYVDREHRLAALAGQMTLNGFRVDQDLLDRRYAEGEKRKRDCLQVLHDGWGLPLTKMVSKGRGKAKTETEEDVPSPLSTDAGRAWLEKFWTESGLDDPPRTQKTGKLSISAEDMKAIAARRPDLAVVCNAIGTVVTTRTVYQTAREHLAEDGRVHPRISMRQASGRWSVTDPGLTVFGKRGGRHVERDIFLPDEGHVLLSFDLSQVDMRAMAWLSGDHAYRAMFAEGRDAHKEIAAQVGITRHDAKAIGHGWNYGLGPRKMIASGLDPDLVYAFIRGMEERFPQLIAWREQIREQGRAGMILENGFGRRMACDPQRAYTVAPALMGQGGARDIMCESLLRLPGETWPMLRVMVHDEIVLSVPRDQVVDVAQAVKAAMTWQLDDDLPVLCDMSGGANWGEASRK